MGQFSWHWSLASLSLQIFSVALKHWQMSHYIINYNASMKAMSKVMVIMSLFEKTHKTHVKPKLSLDSEI